MRERNVFVWQVSSLFHLLSFYHSSFQNYHELQPAGDPGSSFRSEPTPTLHVSKYSIFDNHVSCTLKRFIIICDA